MRLKPKQFVFGLGLGIGILFGLIKNLPDGKLHVVFCDVGQGDAIYIKFPNRADMVIDGGPDNRVLKCLSDHMPFYDRTLDVVALTHPQKDHMQGLIEVLRRYEVKNFITVPVANTTDGYKTLMQLLNSKPVKVKYLTTGNKLQLNDVILTVLWPEKNWLVTRLKLDRLVFENQTNSQAFAKALGATSDDDLNIYSLYLYLQYGQFDLLLTGDGDQKTQSEINQVGLDEILPRNLLVLKVPHHGSRTGIRMEFIKRTKPRISVIEVGKNSYGHPATETIKSLSKWGRVYRTDISGDIEIISNGKNWQIKTSH